MAREAAYLILMIFIINGALCENEEQIKAAHKKCLDETGVAESSIANAAKGEFPHDLKLACYMKCMMMIFKMMDEGGKIAVNENHLKILPEDYRKPVQKMADTCIPKLKSTDSCKKAMELHRCAYKLDPEHYIIF